MAAKEGEFHQKPTNEVQAIYFRKGPATFTAEATRLSCPSRCQMLLVRVQELRLAPAQRA